MWENMKILDILNSEGPLLKCVQKQASAPNEHSLFLEGTYGIQNDNKIYCKTNKHILKLYFDNRVQAKDMFLVRMDEPYFIREKSRIRRIHFRESIDTEIISTIQCGGYFRENPASMRCDPDAFLLQLTNYV
jgi:hypothetical protein